MRQEVRQSPLRFTDSTWPTELQAVVREFGPAEVDKIGKQILGFPPSWIQSTEEALPVINAIWDSKGR